jgi:hypothetical protein
MKLDTSFIGIDVYDHPLNLSSSFGGMTTMLTTQGNVVVSGSLLASGSTTIIGNQTITGSLTISGSATTDLRVIGNQIVSGTLDIRSTGGLGLSNSNGTTAEYFGNSFGGNIGVYKVSDSTEIGLALDGAEWTTNWANGPLLYVNNTPGDTYEGVFGFQNKANYTDGRITALKPLEVTGSLSTTGTFTSSLQEGYVWVGNSTGRTTTVATSSFGGGGGSVNTGSLMVTGSVAVNVLTFTKGDGSTFDLTVAASGSAPAGTISGSSQITALGFAITGSNTFRGNQTIVSRTFPELTLTANQIFQGGM